MTIATQLSVSTSQGNGVTTSFAWDFLIPDAASMVVTLYDQAAATVETVTPSFYMTHGLGDPDGGTIDFLVDGAPVSSGLFVSIYRAAPLVQDVAIKRLGRFFPEAVQTGLDDLTLIFQDIATSLRELQPVIGGPPVPFDTVPFDLNADLLTATTGSFGLMTAGTATASRVAAGLLIEPINDQAVTSGQTFTLSATFTPLSLTQTAAALTVLLPASPVDGETAGFSIDQNVTALTVSGNGHTLKNAPVTTSTASAGWAFSWTYDGPSSTWWRSGGIASRPLSFLIGSATVTYDINSTARSDSHAVTVTGAVVGDIVLVGVTGGNGNSLLGAFRGSVTASNVAWVTMFNLTGGGLNTGATNTTVAVLPKSQFGL